MNEDTKVQDNKVEGKPESDLHADSKPTEGGEAPVSKDRTAEQFEKLTETNRKLSEKLSAYEKQQEQESVLDSLKPKAAPIVQTNVPSFNLPQFRTETANKESDLVDGDGYINADVLKNNLTEAQKRAIEAEKEARMVREQFIKYEENQQVRLAHERFPQLDPHSEQFDRKFYDLTRNELIGQMMNGEKDVLAAAKKVSSFYQPPVKEDAGKDTKKEADEQKQQINAGSRNQPSSRFSNAEDQDLVLATRLGRKGALAERLKRSGN